MNYFRKSCAVLVVGLAAQSLFRGPEAQAECARLAYPQR